MDLRISKLAVIRALILTSVFLFFSCASIDYTAYQIVTPVNVSPEKSKWIIDEPVLNIESHYSTEIIDAYRKSLRKTFGTVKSIRDFNNAPTLNKAIKDNLNVLTFYKQQTDYDYLIETEMKSVRNDLPTFQIYPDNQLTDEIYIRIMVYDLSKKALIYDKEYRFVHQFNGGNNFAFAAKTEKFYKKAITASIKEFTKKYNWNWK